MECAAHHFVRDPGIGQHLALRVVLSLLDVQTICDVGVRKCHATGKLDGIFVQLRREGVERWLLDGLARALPRGPLDEHFLVGQGDTIVQTIGCLNELILLERHAELFHFDKQRCEHLELLRVQTRNINLER